MKFFSNCLSFVLFLAASSPAAQGRLNGVAPRKLVDPFPGANTVEGTYIVKLCKRRYGLWGVR